MLSFQSFRRRPGWARLICGLTTASLLILALGCFGSFPLTNIIYDLNQEISDNRWVQTLTMWVFYLIPVYSLAVLGDVIIFNLVEFWSGEPLLQSAATHTQGAYETAMTLSEDGRTLTMTIREHGQVVEVVTSVEVSPGHFELRDQSGQLLGMVARSEAGDLELRGPFGNTMGRISAGQLAAPAL
jgi:hypothetical protein